MKKIRVRFAPSPTGPLHLGGVRTALYDYLFAKSQGGDFVLRIEDTDTARFVPGAEDYIQEALEWCGIIPDESPKHGGNYGPYRQSERRHIYDQYIDEILKTDYAYIAFDTPEELDAIRKEFEEKGEVFSYNYQTRTRLRNSVALPKEEVERLLADKTPFVIRFKMPFDRVLQLNDIIRGSFTVNTNALDDKVLVKNDGMPTYHFANIIDDHEMEITHVIRGEEWLPSLGLHTLLYEAMGWEAPQFAHLSLILKPEGKGKLSKRDGAKLGFPVFPLDFHDEATGETFMGYREQGYIPAAFINFLALLGWSPADDQEILSMDEMIAQFDLHKVHKAGARFSKEKAEWFNHEYLQKCTGQEVLELIRNQKNISLASIDTEKLLKVISMLKERVNFPQEIMEQGKYFFEAPNVYDEKAVKKAWNEATPSLLTQLKEEVSNAGENADYKQLIHHIAEKNEVGMGKVMMPLRLALVGELKGPDVPDIISVLGKAETVHRIENALAKLS